MSVATLHRVLGELAPGSVVTAGRSRRTRYALRRPLRGELSDIPLYAIDVAGDAAQISNLALVHPTGTLLPLRRTEWPTPAESADGWWDGLPYPLYDVRPQGYLGRQFARAEHERLGVSQNPNDWSDDDIVFVLSRAGIDVPGNLLLGNESYRRWLKSKLTPQEPAHEKGLGEHYVRCADESLRSGVPASSAAGEFPKFTAVRRNGEATPHVIVKFSGAGTSPSERRWADLLICESLALECIGALPGVTGARSRVLQHGARVFLEGERFDRVDLHGRLPVCSLDAINAAFIGAGTSDWTHLASRLEQAGLVDAVTLRAIEHLWWFGRLLANTDMHLANLSFRVAPKLALAPAYDMLPMAYAPLPGGELPAHEFVPPLPLPPQRGAWQRACAAALEFWRRASCDARVSASYQGICAANVRRLDEVAARI